MQLLQGSFEELASKLKSLDDELIQCAFDKSSLEKEKLRLRQSLDGREKLLEEVSARVHERERELERAQHAAERAAEAASRTRQLECDLKDAQEHEALARSTLAALREELVAEKLRAEKLLAAAAEHKEKQSSSLGDDLPALRQSLATKETRIQFLCAKLEEALREKFRLEQELASQRAQPTQPQEPSAPAPAAGQPPLAEEGGQPSKQALLEKENAALYSRIITLQTDLHMLRSKVLQFCPLSTVHTRIRAYLPRPSIMLSPHFVQFLALCVHSLSILVN